MASNFYLKQGDTARPLKAQLSTSILGATVDFRLATTDGAIMFSGAATVIDAEIEIDGVTSSIVEYRWQAGNTNTPGHYLGEFLVTFTGGKQERFPSRDYIHVFIGDSVPLEENAIFTIDTTGSEKLCTDQQIRDLLEEVSEFPGSVFDGVNELAQLKMIAKAHLEAAIGKRIIWKTVTDELHDGDQKNFLFVRSPPIIEVTEINIGDVLQVEGDGYWVYRNHVELLAKTPRGHGNITISYKSGIGNVVSLLTSDIIAKTVALMIVGQVGSGSGDSFAVTAGPVGLRETFSNGGGYSAKSRSWVGDVTRWIRGKRGVRMAVVGGHHPHPSYYDPRRDVWE